MPRPPKNVVATKEEIGLRLRAIRERRGVTQVELAEALGIDQSNVSAIERGVRGLTIHQAVKLAKALKISTDEILMPPDGHHASKTSLKLTRRFRRIEALPETKQRAILKALDALLGLESR